MYSLTEENYLKAMYRLSGLKHKKITPTLIAEEMQNNAASVVDMIKKLVEKKLIQYDKINGVELTDKGSSIAIEIVRKHRLWEVFLFEKLHYSWDVIHDIAEQLEHIKHHELADRLDAFLGFPTHDPHGDPIPNSKGEMNSLPTILLSEIASGEICKVVAVKDTSSDFLQYLKQLQIGIQTSLKVQNKILFDDSMLIEINHEFSTTVSKKFTESLLVQKIE